ncbi:possible NADH dehydrogenase subunit [Xanthomonas phage Xp15]|uniref:Possible NADH dehydrogenase subunit n=1 Tax=Xanthomonas phage Xp15 TaxID=322855 RepID=Q52PM5_9CAUD|nr:possible NADH dehydrogenase subunit [Xanthomonas phage Xp15]AAX84916.1 possible NADH dehydrogenase subunit [Xanthomonas phage Xp15]
MTRSKFRSMHGRSNGIGFESGFEKKFLLQCYQLGIKVERSLEQVAYQDSKGIWHRYNPDFYWPDVNFTVEIKGSWAFRDNHGNVKEKFYAAMVYFKNRYTLITEKELRSDYVAKLYRSLHGN